MAFASFDHARDISIWLTNLTHTDPDEHISLVLFKSFFFFVFLIKYFILFCLFLCSANIHNKVPLSAATKIGYNKAELLKLSGQAQQPKKSDLDKLFDELPSVPRYVDNDSATVRSIKADVQRLSVNEPPEAVASTSASQRATTGFGLSANMHHNASTASTETSVTVGHEAIELSFMPSAPPASPGLRRSTQYSYIPTGYMRFESAQQSLNHSREPQRLPDEYTRPPPFFGQSTSWQSATPRPQPKPKKKSTCVIS